MYHPFRPENSRYEVAEEVGIVGVTKSAEIKILSALLFMEGGEEKCNTLVSRSEMESEKEIERYSADPRKVT